MTDEPRDSIKKTLGLNQLNIDMVWQFERRLVKGKLTRDQDPETHFCVFFAPIDMAQRKVFLGYHKKAGLWIFNGGHIQAGESIKECLKREIGEELGMEAGDSEIIESSLLTITEIDNPQKQTCRRHYDFWFFLNIDSRSIKFNAEFVGKEFSEFGWFGLKECQKFVTDRTATLALGFIQNHFFSDSSSWVNLPKES